MVRRTPHQVADLMRKKKVDLEIQVFGIDGLPLANRAFILKFEDGSEIKGETDGEGHIKENIQYAEGLSLNFDIDIEEKASEEDDFNKFQRGDIYNDPKIPFVDIPGPGFRDVKRDDPRNFDVKDMVVLNVFLVEESDTKLNDITNKYETTLDALEAENKQDVTIVYLSKSIYENFSISRGESAVV